MGSWVPATLASLGRHGQRWTEQDGGADGTQATQALTAALPN